MSQSPKFKVGDIIYSKDFIGYVDEIITVDATHYELLNMIHPFPIFQHGKTEWLPHAHIDNWYAIDAGRMFLNSLEELNNEEE